MADKTVTLKIKVDGQELDVAKENIQQFDDIVADVKTKLSTMKVGSEEWKKLSDELQTAEAAFKATKEEAGNTDTKFKSLRTQIRETTVAMQALEDAGQSNTKEFEQLRAKLDDLNDTQERTAFRAGQIDDKLSAMPGIAGRAGQAFKGFNDSINTFGKTTTAALGIVGLLVAAFAFLVKAIQNNDGAMKKFQPIMIQIEKLMNGVLAAMEPLIDAFIEFANFILPKVTEGFKIFYSVLAAVGQTFTGFVGAFKKAISGDFSGAWEDAKKSVNSFGDNYEAANKRFEEGAKQTTKIEQEELDKKAEKRAAYNEKIKAANEALAQIELEMLKERNLEIANENRKHEKNIEAVKILGNAAIEKEKKRHTKVLEDIDEKYRKKQFEEEMKYLQDFNNAMQTNLTDRYNLSIRNAELIQKNRQLQNKETIEDEIKTFTAIRNYQATIAEDAYKKKRDDYENARDLMDKAGADEIQFEKDTQYVLAQMDRNRAQEKVNFTLETYNTLAEISKRAKDKEKEAIFDEINYEITMLDKLSAEMEFDFQDDIKRNNHKIEELKRLQKIEEDAARGQADVLLKIKRDYSDKINKIEVDNVNLVRMAEDQKAQIRLTYAQAAQGIGQIMQQLAGQNADLAIAGIYIEKAAALVSIAINAQRNFIKDGGATSPLAWANLTLAAVSAATVIVQAAKGISDINGARGQASSASSTGGNQYADGSFRGYAEGGLIGGRRHAQGGTMIEAEAGEAIMTRGAVTMFAPLLSAINQMGGGTSFGSTMVSTYDKPKDSNNTSEQPIIKTYVVESDLTSAQHRQARLKDLSTL
jgi:hypothetical protein